LIEKSQVFQLSIHELIILNAFLLALPIPPLLSKIPIIQVNENKQKLKQSIQSLQKKGYISGIVGRDQQKLILPELIKNLRTMAYANEMVQIYLNNKGEKSRQIALFHYEGYFVQQELLAKNTYHIQKSNNLGKFLIDKMLIKASESFRGTDTQIPLEAWHNLLASRESGNVDEVLSALVSEDKKADWARVREQLLLMQDILSAKSILVLTSTYDRLAIKLDNAAFILGQGSNWLAFPYRKSKEDVGKLIALQVPRQNLFLACESIFSTMNLIMNIKERSK